MGDVRSPGPGRLPGNVAARDLDGHGESFRCRGPDRQQIPRRPLAVDASEPGPACHKSKRDVPLSHGGLETPEKAWAGAQSLDPAADPDRKPFVMRPVSILIASATGLSGMADLGAIPKWEQMDYGSFLSSSVTLPWSEDGEIARERIFRESTTKPSAPSPEDSAPLPSRPS